MEPWGRMRATAETFRMMTQQVKSLADDLGDGRLMMTHEGGYSEVYVPFCGHHVLAEMSGSLVTAPDPFSDVFPLRQPSAAFDRFLDGLLDEMIDAR